MSYANRRSTTTGVPELSCKMFVSGTFVVKCMKNAKFWAFGEKQQHGDKTTGMTEYFQIFMTCHVTALLLNLLCLKEGSCYTLVIESGHLQVCFTINVTVWNSVKATCSKFSYDLCMLDTPSYVVVGMLNFLFHVFLLSFFLLVQHGSALRLR